MASCLLVPTKITRTLVPTFVSSGSVLDVTLPEGLFLGSNNGLHLDCVGLACVNVIGVIGQGVDQVSA